MAKSEPTTIMNSDQPNWLSDMERRALTVGMSEDHVPKALPCTKNVEKIAVRLLLAFGDATAACPEERIGLSNKVWSPVTCRAISDTVDRSKGSIDLCRNGSF